MSDGRSTRHGTVEERFNKGFKLCKKTGCWLWKGCVDGSGYGQVKDKGRIWKSHRYSFSIYVGDIPEGLCVLHTCDVPSCVNPEHLFLGTKADNTKDMIEKGRDNFKCGTGAINPLKGEDNPSSKLTEEQVREILDWDVSQGGRWGSGEKLKDLAKRMGVHIQTVDRIRMRKSWKHL